MNMDTLYARLERVGDTICYEYLHEHLAYTGIASLLLYTSIFKPLACRKPWTALAAALAGLLHDIGKVLKVYQSDGARVLEGALERISFSKCVNWRGPLCPHEYASACIVPAILLDSIPTHMEKVLGVGSPTLCYYVLAAVRNHHQGLRLLTFEDVKDVYTRIRGSISADDVENINTVLQRAIERFRELLQGLRMGIPQKLYDLVNSFFELKLELKSVAEFCNQCNAEGSVDELRIIGGIVVAADFIATAINLRKVSTVCITPTRLLREVMMLAKAVLGQVWREAADLGISWI